MIDTQRIQDAWTRLSTDPRVQRGLYWFRQLIVVAVVGLIVYQLIDIGWRDILRSLPTEPLFYLLFVGKYLSLPTAEIFIYRQVWSIRPLEGFKAFLIKRVYNDEVMGYSGEFYLFLWGSRRVDEDDKQVLKDVRDNNIISAVTSTLVAFLLVGALVFGGHLEILELVDNVGPIYLITGLLVIVAIYIAVFQFRKYLFDLPLKKALVIFSIYMTRFLIHHGLLMLMWMVVIPDVPLSIWFTFLAAFIVMNRIPLLPSRDLLFVGAGIELSRILDMAMDSVAGMLLVISALQKGAHLGLFLIISYYAEDPDLEKVEEEKATLPFTDNLDGTAPTEEGRGEEDEGSSPDNEPANEPTSSEATDPPTST